VATQHLAPMLICLIAGCGVGSTRRSSPTNPSIPATAPAGPLTRPWFAAVDAALTPEEADIVRDDLDVPPACDLADFYADKIIHTYSGTVRLRREVAFTILLKTNTLTTESVGAGGKIPAHAYALRTLLRQPDARDAFLDLLSRARYPAGEMWALCGLRLTDPEAFEERVGPFLDSRDAVNTQFGCIGMERPVKQVAEHIRRGGLWGDRESALGR
jgi:hypothetical protein